MTGDEYRRVTSMLHLKRDRPILIAVELLSGLAIGSILASTLITTFDALIVFVIIVLTAVAVLDFSDYLPAFSLAYFVGYISEFIFSISRVLGGLKILVLVLALIGLGAVVAIKAGRRSERPEPGGSSL
ncbi:MAG: hypothetical protein LUQ32_06565 [Methanomicrobiales archaeon]|nr:hypothetical protein [Methanomicrobiales archaeon]